MTVKWVKINLTALLIAAFLALNAGLAMLHGHFLPVPNQNLPPPAPHKQLAKPPDAILQA